MNGTELRIGNLVDITNRVQEIHMPCGVKFRVMEIHQGFVCGIIISGYQSETGIIDWVQYMVRDICEIELTAELLTTCGFTQSGCYWVNNGVYVWEHGLGDYITFNQQRIGSIGINREIKYLHQLQNLYFALTGDELNYTP